MTPHNHVDPLYFHIIQPSEPLRPYIKEYRVLRNDCSLTELRQTPNIPDGGLEIVINFASPVQRHDPHDMTAPSWWHQAWVIGPGMHMDVLAFGAQVQLFNIAFRPGGAYPFFKLPLSDLYNQWLPLSEVMPRSFLTVLDNMGFCTMRQRIERIEQWLMRQVDTISLPHLDVMHALSLTRYHVPHRQLMRHLTQHTYLSERKLERLFRQQVGIQPQQYLRLQRFWRASDRLLRGQHRLVDVALASGYYDQSHMTNDFRQITGQAPRLYYDMWRHVGLFQDTHPLS